MLEEFLSHKCKQPSKCVDLQYVITKKTEFCLTIFTGSK